MSQHTFTGLGVSELLAAELDRRGISEPFPVQRMVIGDVLDGHDVLAKSPTGSGKTLAFGIPLVERLGEYPKRPAALVLAPTRELAIQIVEELRPLAHLRAQAITAVYGGAGIAKQARLAARSHILVATPGRLVDLIERGEVTLGTVSLVVLDEADRMLDMGFRPVVERIVGMTAPDRQTLLFSATLDGEVGRLAKAYTRSPRRHEHTHPPEQRGKIDHRFVGVGADGRVGRLIAELAHPERGLTLVFVRTKRGADRLVKRLGSAGVNAVAMHGDKTQGQRERALAKLQSGELDTLVATDVAARGIDITGITHVINFDIPGTGADYVHRVGRTARAGASGTGITLVAPEQRRELGALLDGLGLEEQMKQAWTRAGERPRSNDGGDGENRRRLDAGGDGENRPRSDAANSREARTGSSGRPSGYGSRPRKDRAKRASNEPGRSSRDARKGGRRAGTKRPAGAGSGRGASGSRRRAA